MMCLLVTVMGPPVGAATEDTRITVDGTSVVNCGLDSSLSFDLGTVDVPQRVITKTQTMLVSCDVPVSVTLQGTLQRGNKAEAGGDVPSLEGCVNGGQGRCFDLTQAGHGFDVSTAGTEIGIRVTYRAPAGLGTDTFSGQLTVSWP